MIARLILPLVAAGVLGACGASALRTASPTSPGSVIATLPGAPATEYVAEAGSGAAAVDDPTGALGGAFDRAFTARGATLRGDPRLAEFSRFVAGHFTPERMTPNQAALETAARHFGLAEPSPHLLMLGVDVQDIEGIEAALQRDIEAMLARRNYSHYGGVSVRREGMLLYVAALSHRFVEFAPIPRAVDPGDAITLSGKLTHGYSEPELAVTLPDGRVERGEPSSALEFRVPFERPGIYRLEVLGQGPEGITVLANFPVYVGEEPPTQVELAKLDGPPVDPERAVGMFLELLNQERARANLEPLVLDEELSRVAKAHVEDMLANNFIGHTSKTTGGPNDRVARAGIRTAVVLENIGLGASPREAHEALLASPGHRGNILNDQVTNVGIAVQTTTDSGKSEYLVTELFTRVTPKLGKDAGAELLRRINARRKAAGLSQLTADGTLRAIAERTARRYFSAPPGSDAALMQGLKDELARAKLTARSVGAVLTVGSSLQELSGISAVLEPGVTLIGLGLSQGTRPESIPNAICAVFLLGQ